MKNSALRRSIVGGFAAMAFLLPAPTVQADLPTGPTCTDRTCVYPTIAGDPVYQNEVYTLTAPAPYANVTFYEMRDGKYDWAVIDAAPTVTQTKNGPVATTQWKPLSEGKFHLLVNVNDGTPNGEDFSFSINTVIVQPPREPSGPSTGSFIR